MPLDRLSKEKDSNLHLDEEYDPAHAEISFTSDVSESHHLKSRILFDKFDGQPFSERRRSNSHYKDFSTIGSPILINTSSGSSE